jgi:CubicO group peptidase (beta-lactamase class C family)
MSIPYAAGALYSSVSDLYKWNRFLLTRTPAVVQAATLADMFTPRVPIDRAAPDKRQYGYGWEVAGSSSEVTYSHGGNIDGFTSYNLIRPRDQLSITVLSNLETVEPDLIAWNLAEIASR